MNNMVRVLFFLTMWTFLYIYCQVRTVFPVALTSLRKVWLIGSIFPSLSSNAMILWMKSNTNGHVTGHVINWWIRRRILYILAFLKMTTGICKVIRLKWINNIIIIIFLTKLADICYLKLHRLDFLYGICWRTDHQLSACAFIKPTI